MIEITTIPQEVQVKQTFTISGTAFLGLKGKTLTLTVDNQFTSFNNLQD